MKSLVKIVFGCWLVLAAATTLAQGASEKALRLLTDRGFCVSGDTVWVKVKLPADVGPDGLVVRFQLESVDGRLVESVAVVSSRSWADGFLPIADSLSSGQYFVTAFLLNQGNREILPVTKSLLVYNRFDEDIAQLNFIESSAISDPENSGGNNWIQTERESYKPREKVNVEIELPPGFNFDEAVFSAALADPLQQTTAGYLFDYRFSPMPETNFVEKNGFLVTGKITGLNGVVQPNVLVVISLPVVKGFFDYCITDSTGTFHFFLKNGFGTADAIFQVFSASGTTFQLQLENGALQRTEVVRNELVTLNSHQTGFVKNALASSFASHIFSPGKLIQSTGFSMSLPDSIPFYGVPDYHVKPEEFIDLPDFREISRELLHGFQYRIKNDKIVFRMINRTRSEFFKAEPLRLINGIPVFDNQLFASLKSTEIEYIDLVLTERIYGDLIIEGVIEVALRDKSNTWLGKQQNLFRRSIDLLQPAKASNYGSQVAGNVNEPDTRQVFIWEKIGGETRKVSFDLSDRKGIVEISVEGFSSQNGWFKSVKQIEVK